MQPQHTYHALCHDVKYEICGAFRIQWRRRCANGEADDIQSTHKYDFNCFV